MKKYKQFFFYAVIIAMAILAALNYKIFVFPNRFAPAGIDGLCTIIQYLTHTDIGYLSLLFNIPLILCGIAFFSLKKDYIIKNAVYILTFSCASLLLGMVDLSPFLYDTPSGTSVVLSPIAGGVIRGLLYAATLKSGGASGGIDMIAAMVKTRRPHYNIMNIIFALNAAVAILSYFVYGFQVEPVICSIIYAFVTSTVSKSMQSLGKGQIRFEIITANAERLCATLTNTLGAGATILDAHGAYSGTQRKMVICVTNREKAAKIEDVLAEFEDAIVFESRVDAAIHLPPSAGK